MATRRDRLELAADLEKKAARLREEEDIRRAVALGGLAAKAERARKALLVVMREYPGAPELAAAADRLADIRREALTEKLDA